MTFRDFDPNLDSHYSSATGDGPSEKRWLQEDDAVTERVNVIPAIEIFDHEVRLRNLRLTTRHAIDYLRRIPELERLAVAAQAMDIGFRCFEQVADQRDTQFVRGQIDRLMADVTTAVARIPQILKTEILKELGPDSGVLAPVQRAVTTAEAVLGNRIENVNKLLSEEIDPDHRNSTVGRALGAVRDMVDPKRSDSVQAAIIAAVNEVTAPDGKMAASMKTALGEALTPLVDELDRLAKQIAVREAVEDVVSHTTLKGLPFEEQVVVELRDWAEAVGALVTHVGVDNEAGDIFVEFPATGMAGGGPKIVIEARDRSTAMGRKAIADTLSRAMAERCADAGIYLSRTREGLAKEIGDWSEGAVEAGPWVATVHDNLVVAIRLIAAFHKIECRQRANPEPNVSAIRAQIDRMRISLKRIASVNRQLSDIRTSGNNIQDEMELLRSEVRGALITIEDALRFVTTNDVAEDA